MIRCECAVLVCVCVCVYGCMGVYVKMRVRVCLCNCMKDGGCFYCVFKLIYGFTITTNLFRLYLSNRLHPTSTIAVSLFPPNSSQNYIPINTN